MINRQVQMSICLSNGNPLEEYLDENANRFVEGRKKSTFSIKLINHSSIRRKAIVSVDGLSVIDGQPASDKSDGYIIEPYGEITIDGWRTSLATVNQFFFDKLEKSYSNSMSYNRKNVGVIGAMIFNEWKDTPVYRGFNWTQTQWGGGYVSNTPTAAMVNNSIGTGFGDELNQPAFETTAYKFVTRPETILTIYYDDREGLEKRGIIIDRNKGLPNAFPEYSGGTTFAKHPPMKRFRG